MDMDEIHSKFTKMSNGQKMDMEEDDEEHQQKRTGTGVDPATSGGLGRYYNWPSSRIVRVSRASGGKDRHSKVLTSKGLRDRRVRLSVNTAIQFYDLQDRLGYDQPSKAVEWLLKAAASSIAELPPMNSPLFDTFPDTPNSYEKRPTTTNQLALVEYPNELSHQQQQQNVAPVTKSCSSNSETSKGSGSGGLSLSRSENRVKARERAKERVQLEKEKETSPHHPNVTSLHPISQATSFTELLNGGISNRPNSPTNTGGNTQWGSAPMDYFSTGLLGRSGQMTPLFEHHQFSFLPDHLLSNNNGSGEYNLNFSMSSGNNNSNSSGYNRGTLQSNSSNLSLLPHHQLQRFNPTIDGSLPNFFIQSADNHHQFLSGFDGRLHLSYGDSARRHEKGKNGT